MDTQSFEIFAELSIAVLGFSGITAAIGSQTQQKSFLAARAKGLLFAGGVAAIFSVAPLTDLSLAYCAIGYMCSSSSLLVWAFFGLHRNPQARSSIFIFSIGNAIIITAIGALAYSLALAPELLPKAYVFALSMVLLLAGIFFVRLVLALTSSER